jgi:hypothetical protein
MSPQELQPEIALITIRVCGYGRKGMEVKYIQICEEAAMVKSVEVKVAEKAMQAGVELSESLGVCSGFFTCLLAFRPPPESSHGTQLHVMLASSSRRPVSIRSTSSGSSPESS